MSGFNVLSQIFGSKEGHVLNTAVDSAADPVVKAIGRTVLTDVQSAVVAKLGVPATAAGLVSYVETKIDSAIDSESALDSAEKAILVEAANALVGELATLAAKI